MENLEIQNSITEVHICQQLLKPNCRNDDSYLDEILKSTDPLSSEGQSISKSQFTQQYNDKLMANDSRVRKRLEEEAYNALK